MLTLFIHRRPYESLNPCKDRLQDLPFFIQPDLKCFLSGILDGSSYVIKLFVVQNEESVMELIGESDLQLTILSIEVYLFPCFVLLLD